MSRMSKENFYNWKKHPVTEEVFLHLRGIKDSINSDMVAEATISGIDCRAILHKFLGSIEVIDYIVNLQLEDFVEEESDVDVI